MTDSVVNRRRARTLFALIAVSVLIVDVLTKIAAVAWLRPAEPVPVLGDLLRLYLIRNPGAAFSIGEGATWVFTILAVVVLAFLLIAVVPGLRHRGWAVGLGLVVAGISGNLGDRLFRTPGFARGHVVDFLQLPYWPIFNVADMAVVFGAGTIVFCWLVKGVGHDGVLESEREDAKRVEQEAKETAGE
ncbi:MAG: signal peptidase II [Propionibacteriaceae bacterium]|nr:signal peptidase II [Propionibacteriaceae bacterium]